MVVGSAEFEEASNRVVEKLKHWAVQELHDDIKNVHMFETPDVDDSDLMDHDALETAGYLWHLKLFGGADVSGELAASGFGPASVSGGESSSGSTSSS